MADTPNLRARKVSPTGWGSLGLRCKGRSAGHGPLARKGGINGIGTVTRAPPVTDLPRLPGTGGQLLLRHIIFSPGRFRPVRRSRRTRPLPKCARGKPCGVTWGLVRSAFKAGGVRKVPGQPAGHQTTPETPPGPAEPGLPVPAFA